MHVAHIRNTFKKLSKMPYFTTINDNTWTDTKKQKKTREDLVTAITVSTDTITKQLAMSHISAERC